ncbi:hypothetical protein C8J57DRAFT_1284448 [Mycena rebaudengoi]|nr:hypothetical protein C8J57DRAFT_1284448 [Mycena rebaudengoi]
MSATHLLSLSCFLAAPTTLSPAKDMAILARVQSGPKYLPTRVVDRKPRRADPIIPRRSRRGNASPPVADTVETMVYAPVPTTAPMLRASQIPDSADTANSANADQPAGHIHYPSSRGRMSEREIAFIVTAALFGLGALLLGIGIAHLICRRRRERRSSIARGLAQEQGIGRSKEFDDSTWGTPMDDKWKIFQENAIGPTAAPQPTPAPRLLPVSAEETRTSKSRSADLTRILEQFEERLHQEETDIALALHIAFGDDPSSSGDNQSCAPFLSGSDDDVTTMMSLQAGMESVGKRAGGIRNRARGGSDASASSQSTTMTTEGFSSHNSSRSSLTSIESMSLSEIEESEEAEEDVVYEVKRAQTHSMEIQKGKLVAWQPGGLRLMVTRPSTNTLATVASSSISVDLNDFPSPP